MRLIIILSILLYSCASISPLEGGDKDTQAPVLIKSNLKETNFTESEINLEFDEYVELNKPETNIKIYPEHTTLKFSVNKKKITVKFDSTLHSNTTYYLKIDNGIKDVREGNLYSYDYLLSTGSVRDTGQVNIIIPNIKSFKNIKIALTHGEVKDSLRKFPFVYILPGNTENISFKGLSDKTYTCWVYTDNDLNNLPDWYAPIGFSGEFKPDTSIKINLEQWNPKLKLKQVKTDGDYLKFIYEKNPYYHIGLEQLLPNQYKQLLYANEDSALFEMIPYSNAIDTVDEIDPYLEMHQIILNSMTILKGETYILQYLIPQFYTNQDRYVRMLFTKTEYKQAVEQTIIYSPRIEETDTVSLKDKPAIDKEKLSRLTIKVQDSLEREIEIRIKKDNKIIYYAESKNEIDIYIESGNITIEIYEGENSKKIDPFLMKKGPEIIYSRSLILKASWEENLQIKLK